MAEKQNKIYSEPGASGGSPVFLGTNVPVRTLLEYLESGLTLDAFLEKFPLVTRERAVAFLEEAAGVSELSEVDRIKKYDTVVASGQATLRALLTLNGGATLALLTFMGHLSEKGPPLANVDAFVGALRYFICGTFAAVLGYGTIFLTNCLSYDGRVRWSDRLFYLTLLVGAASLVFFLIASNHAVGGFNRGGR